MIANGVCKTVMQRQSKVDGHINRYYATCDLIDQEHDYDHVGVTSRSRQVPTTETLFSLLEIIDTSLNLNNF